MQKAFSPGHKQHEDTHPLIQDDQIMKRFVDGYISVIYGLSSTAATLVPARYHAMC